VVALKAPLNAALDLASLRWDSRVLAKDELPDELLAMKHQVFIFLLPRVFESLNFSMASFFSSLWLFGKGKMGDVKKDDGLPGSYYWRFKLGDFNKSATLSMEVKSTLDKNLNVLPQMGTPASADDNRWQNLRLVASSIKKRHKKAEQWSESTRDYRSISVMPDVLLEYRQIDTGTYISDGENPLNSDAYAALGHCAVRAYLWAEIKKQPKDDRIFVRPKRIGVRVWDKYDFEDRQWVSNLGSLSNLASRFLGFWADASDGSRIVLRNSDFKAFKDNFMPRYNKFLDSKRSNKPRLVCRDFAVFSEYVEVDINSTSEYPLIGLT
jgi:hypothetical protein